ncbi:DUF6318 family protein [Isoptericola croceus]|uniref:DUF6318 family protein n=1 Tax=Isoptericola croceus TaxID=3031406 RepID=UPI0023F7D746|nr:DUF6318 family protein [Isoptericola croceus]
MTRTTRHSRTDRALLKPAAAALAGALLLAGCTGEDPPPEEPEPSAAVSPAPTPAEASPSASPEPSEPEMPERPAAMDKKDSEGAAAAAVYFLELYDYSLKTGDTTTFEQMSHRACGFCDDTVQEASTIAREQKTYRGGELVGKLVQTHERDPVTGIYPLDMDVTQAPAEIVDSKGSIEWSQDRAVTEARVEMGLRDGEWVVVEIAGRPQ